MGVKRLGEERIREMRTLAGILMAVRDGTPAASPTAASLEESDYARSQAVKAAKSEGLLQKAKIQV